MARSTLPSTRTRAVTYLQSRCSRTARFWPAVLLAASAGRRAATLPGSMPSRAWLIRSTRTQAVQFFHIAVQADGKILAGGQFTHHRRTGRATGSPGSIPRPAWPTYRSTRTRTTPFSSIAVQADGKILAGGQFSRASVDRRAPHRPAGCHTGLADSFNPNANSSVFSIAVQPDGKILVGGTFTNIGGQPRSRMARLDAATGLGRFVQPGASTRRSLNRSAGGWQDPGGRPLLTARTASADKHATASPGSTATTGLADSFDPNADNIGLFNCAPGGREDHSRRPVHRQ